MKIIISGINGKIGSYIYRLATEKSYQVVCGIDKKTVSSVDCPVYSSFYEVKELADVIIDFSSPTMLGDLIEYATQNNLPLVIGTTGYTKENEEQIINASKQIPVFKSANTSLGINLLLKLCKTTATALNGYDVEIIEKHHNHKKDSPSGTAKSIYDVINFAKGENQTAVHGRNGNGARTKNEIGIHALRGGTVVGEHSVFFFGKDETITLTHTATSKELFASGALNCAEFIIGKPNGLYGMNDTLNL